MTCVARGCDTIEEVASAGDGLEQVVRIPDAHEVAGTIGRKRVVEQLAQRKVFVDSRPRVGLRLSPHFFNTDEEIDRAMTILASLMG